MSRSTLVAQYNAMRVGATPRLKFRLLCLLGALSAIVPCRVHAAVFYPLSSGQDYDLPNGVSRDGRVILTTRHTWTPSGEFVPVAPAASEVWSRDISNDGVVVGLWCGPNTGSCYEAFHRPAGGEMQGLGSFDNSSSDAFAVTPDGSVIVGAASSPTGTQSFRWTEATGLVGLGHLRPGLFSHGAAFGVSADGSVVVGQSGDDTNLEAYRWTAATGMVGLGDIPGGNFDSIAEDISSDGQVIVGGATSAQGREAFRWTQATGMVSLGELPGGDYYSIASATTADGSIVVGETVTNLGAEAFIWDAAQGMQRLRDVLVSEHGLGAAMAGWTLTKALDISDNGNVIIGYAYDQNGQASGFVVIIPEPASAALMTVALLGIVVGTRGLRHSN